MSRIRLMPQNWYTIWLSILLFVSMLACSRDSDLERVNRVDGDTREFGTMKNSQKHGQWTTLFEGELYTVKHWRNGKLHGPWQRWLDPEGLMTSDGLYIDGIPHGRFRILYAPGRLAELGWYSHGRRERTWCSWNEDGSLEYIKIFQQDELMREDLSPPGQCPVIFGEGARHLDPKDKNFE